MAQISSSSSSYSRSLREKAPGHRGINAASNSLEVNEETPPTTFPRGPETASSILRWTRFLRGKARVGRRRGGFPGQKGRARLAGEASVIPGFFPPRREIVGTVFRALYRFRSSPLGSQLSTQLSLLVCLSMNSVSSSVL